MQFKSLKSKILTGSAVLSVALFLTACPSKITEEQLAQLQELRKAEASLKQQLSEKKSEKAGLERELSSREAELKKCQEDTDFVKRKLSQWPNVWPDWKPEEPKPETE